MKKFVLYFIIAVMVIAFSGCAPEEIPEEIVGNLVTETTEPTEEKEKIILKLGADGEEKEYSIGDTFGEWKIAELEVDGSENEIDHISAYFEGNLTLEGYIERNPLMEEGYDIVLCENDIERMPFCVYPGFKEIMGCFGLVFSDDVKNLPILDWNESADVRIEISGFNFGRAYTEGLDWFDVTKIEYIEEESKVPPRAEKVAFQIGRDGEEKALSVGDTIGIWTLENLQAHKDEEKGDGFYTSVNATFSGEVRLKGNIGLNPYNGAGYQFFINDYDDVNKMPWLVSNNLGNVEQTFLIGYPEVENMPNLKEGEYFPCYLTIKNYTINRGYTEVFDSAEVIKIEIPEKDTGLPKLYEDIIVNFGAKVNDFGELYVKTGISLYYDREGCIFGKESADVFYSWIMARTPVEDRIKVLFPGYIEEMYALDAEYYEAEVYKYFGVSSERLRRSEIYYPEQKCYFLDYGGGIGETPGLIINSIEERNDYVVFSLTIDYDFADWDYNMVLAVKLLPDGRYNYSYYLPE